MRRIASLLGNPSHDSWPRAWRSTYRCPWPIPFGLHLGRGTIPLGGVVVVGVCLLVTGDVRCPCPAQGPSTLLSPVFCLHAWTGVCAKSDYLSSFQSESEKRSGRQEELCLRARNSVTWSRCHCMDVNMDAEQIQADFLGFTADIVITRNRSVSSWTLGQQILQMLENRQMLVRRP